MELERRGKFPGLKAHFTKDECEAILALSARKKAIDKAIKKKAERAALGKKPKPELDEIIDGAEAVECDFVTWATPIARQIRKAIEKDPSILADRTEDEIKAELEAELKKSQTKLAQIAEGKEWKTHD